MESIIVHPSKSQVVLPIHVLEGIKSGQDDFKAGRTMTLDEFQKKRVLRTAI